MWPAKIEESEISIRTSNVLRNNGFTEWSDVAAWSALELIRLPGLGRHTLHDIREALRVRGLALQPDRPAERVYVPADVREARRQDGLAAHLRKLGWTCIPPQTP